MNYLSIHDSIINRAKNRIRAEGYESHHILPRCEGGLENSEQVFLSQKEHSVIHKLRYEITGVVGNLIAYRLMKYGRKMLNENHTEISRAGGKAHHQIYRQNPELYSIRQKKSGIVGGNKCRDEKIGFFQLTEEEMKKAKSKGRQTIVREKLGMFSDEYREKHKELLHKKVYTPDGIFNSLTEASQYYKVSRSTMTYRVNSDNFKEWFLIKGEK